jgi:hypothetical protein
MNPESPYQQPQGPAPGMSPNPGLPQAMPPAAPQQPIQQSPYLPVGLPASQRPKKHHSWGLIIALVIFVLGFFASSGFGFWAYAEMQDYKNNVDQKVATAVQAAVKVAEETKEKEFLERSKSPYKTYKTPATFGSVEITYPKTWSASIDEQGNGVSGYFHPDYVPGPKSETAFALRLEVLDQPYDKILGQYDGEARKGTVKVVPYKAERVPSVLGARVDGEIERGIRGSAVVFPLRDKSIRISTYSSQSFGVDFADPVLKQLIFTP